MLASPLLIVLALMLIVGLVLLIRGLRGRRVGSEPHCRKCNYNLTGLTAKQCPECGAVTAESGVVVGVRRRRARSLVIGAILLAVGVTGAGLGLVGHVRGVNWYRYFPTFLLVAQAVDDDEHLAIDELARRCKNRTLTEAHVAELIPTALDRQGGGSSGQAIWSWIRLLAAMDNIGALSRAQGERFYDQMVTLELEVRPRIRHGDEFAVSFGYWIRGDPSLTGECKIVWGEARIGNIWRQQLQPGASTTLSGAGQGGSSGYSVSPALFEPGRYTVECAAERQFLCWADTDWSTPSFTRQVVLSAEFEILPPEAPSDVRLVDDPSLADAIRDAISIRVTDNPWNMAEPEEYLLLRVSVTGGVPIDCAFEVFGLDGSRERRLGEFTIKKRPAGRGTHEHSSMVPALDVEQVALVLRSSAEVARKTTDIFEIWDGELRLDPIPVERSRK